MQIRRETPADYDAVFHVIKAAFASAEQSDGAEQELVAALRSSPSFVPSLSLVAVEDEQVVGHVLFTEAKVGTHTVLALAPLSVLPSHQRKGIGLALIREGHRIAKELGYDCSVVLGHPDYYPKAGYRPAGVFGIRPPFDVPDENFMAIRLNGPGEERMDGVLRYDPAFGIEPPEGSWQK